MSETCGTVSMPVSPIPEGSDHQRFLNVIGTLKDDEGVYTQKKGERFYSKKGVISITLVSPPPSAKKDIGKPCKYSDFVCRLHLWKYFRFNGKNGFDQALGVPIAIHLQSMRHHLQLKKVSMNISS